MNDKALSIIVRALGDNPLRGVQACESAKDLWERLSERYAGKMVVNKLGLLKNLVNTRLKRGENIGDHIAVFEA